MLFVSCYISLKSILVLGTKHKFLFVSPITCELQRESPVLDTHLSLHHSALSEWLLLLFP